MHTCVIMHVCNEGCVRVHTCVITHVCVCMSMCRPLHGPCRATRHILADLLTDVPQVAMYSARAEAVHDGECPYKLLPCIRGCEMQIQRKVMAAHADGPCSD